MTRTGYLLLYLAGLCLADVSYDGESVLRMKPYTSSQLNFLEEFIASRPDLDLWQEPEGEFRPVDIRVSRDEREDLIDMFRSEGILTEVMVDDVQSSWDAQIEDWLEMITERCGRDCELDNIGESFEGRRLLVLKITKPGGNRRGVWLDSTIHAREWVAPATTAYWIGRLILDEDTDDEIADLREAYDFYVMVVLNPDGYEYSWTTDRMWRKTRTPAPGSSCYGVDGNRNYDIGYGQGSSTNPCTQTYRGEHAFSEPELKQMADYIHDEQEKRVEFDFFLTVHSYTQVLIIPYGYTHSEDPDNYDELVHVATIGGEAINDASDVFYEYRRSNGIFGGNSMDWGLEGAGIPYSYLLELRDTGEHGFLLPPEYILPTARETFTGVKAMLKEIIRLRTE